MGAAERVIERCRVLAACTEVPGETTRTFLCEAMREVHGLVRGWMTDAGMAVRIDSMGNVRGLFGAANGPRVVIASHLDTVPQAGAFDGILGVMLGIELVAGFGAGLPFGVEVIGFSEEEGIRFRRPFLGSMAAVGTLGEEALGLADAAGVTVAEAIRGFGLDPATIDDARFAAETMAYVEFHIEQGPVLESLDCSVGVVETLVGQTRMEMVFDGQANHAGTTPMGLRRDALAAAAEWIVGVEAMACGMDGLVATVGRVTAYPGAGNVVPGRVAALLDVRHRKDSVRAAAVAGLTERAGAAGAARGVRVGHTVLLEQAAVPLDQGLARQLEEAAREAGFAAPRMTSGAGHDAMIVAPHVASAMLFIRSPGGISHHPEESVRVEDVEAALAVGHLFLRRLGEGLSAA